VIPQSAATAPAPSSRQEEQVRQAVDRFFERRREEELTAKSEPPKPQEDLFDKDSLPIPLAQLLDTYLICQKEDQMVIVDQHAAAERIRYERLSRELQKGSLVQQTLLFPATVEVSTAETPLLEENLPLFRKLGFDIEFFGQNTFNISATPALFKIDNCETLIKDLLKDLTSVGNSTTLDELHEKMLISMACHRSLRAGTRLTQEGMQDLIEQLYKAEYPFTCPHGRPTLVALSTTDLERMFKRSGF